ncbi:MAG: chemotaxis protein CheW, partial [Fibrobacterota bacterium]
GMDVVKRNIEKMNGEIDINSEPGKGSTFIIRIPLTLAIIDGMLVKSGNDKYTIPTLSIKRSITCTEDMITRSPEGEEILNLDGNFLPIVKLGRIFGQASAVDDSTQGILVILEHAGKEIALLTDEIIGQQQTVIKGLSSYLGKARGTSGCTILGDGSVSLIIDIRTMLDIAEEVSAAGRPTGDRE